MNENKEFFEILCKNIKNVIVDNVILSGGTFDIITEKSIITNNLTKRLYFNNSLVKLKRTKITYICHTCGNTHTILLKKFLVKKTLNCINCAETYDKRLNQSMFMKETYSKNGKIKPKKIKIKPKKINSIDYINESNNDFFNESKIFIKNYYNTHINIDDFNKIKKSIIKVNGILFNDNFIFYEHLKTNNQIKYSSYLYDFKNDLFINFNNITYKCDNCGCTFNTTRKPKEKINNYKIMCKNCSFVNKTFKLRKHLNINNDIVNYQSKPELKVINFMNNKKILIKNGPILDYYFNNKLYHYYVDFEIPDKKILLEIKDNHIWHKEQVKSGKWLMKERIAKKYAKENNMVYKIIFTQYLDDFLNTF